MRDALICVQFVSHSRKPHSFHTFVHYLYHMQNTGCVTSVEMLIGTQISGWEGAQTRTSLNHRPVPLELDCFAGNSLIWSHQRWLKICLHMQLGENEQKIAIIWERPGQ